LTTEPPGTREPLASTRPEVRPYLKRLLLAILVGLLVMVATAIWAWRTYGGRLEGAPPLPSGTPPLSTLPATTR